MNKANNSSTCSYPLTDTTARIGVISSYCFIFVVSAVGNGSVGLIVYKIKTLSYRINFFIVNMAMSDLLFLISVGIAIMLAFKPSSWIFRGSSGDTMCKIKELLPSFSVAVSIQSLVLISVERFEAVVFPLRSPIINLSRCSVFIIVTWIVAIAINLPKCLAWKLSKHPEKIACELHWNQMFGESSSHANYLLATFAVLFYFPVVLITVLYSIIICKLQSQMTPGETSLQVQNERVRRNKNVLKMSIAIVIAFVLCWVPWSIGAILIEFDVSLPCGFFIFWITDNVLLVSNSAINPCICFTFSRNYQMSFKKILKCFHLTQRQRNTEQNEPNLQLVLSKRHGFLGLSMREKRFDYVTTEAI
ncbi:QRFP-like peptide receptor [Montipora capricornis]|uniref:QRFP-like peptide receptor n=1 Tax=Montipora capricornis TaxID=246305 RepID=UPI0035F11A25